MEERNERGARSLEGGKGGMFPRRFGPIKAWERGERKGGSWVRKQGESIKGEIITQEG